MKYLYKYPQRAYPYNRHRGHERAPEPYRARIRADRHRRLRRRPVLRRVRRIREGVAGGSPRPNQRLEPRAGSGHRAPSPHALVPEHLDVVPRIPEAVALHRRGPQGNEPGGRVPCRAGPALPVLRRRPAPPVHGERDQHPADPRHPLGHALREGRHQRVPPARPGRCREPEGRRDEGVRALHADRRRRRRQGGGPAPDHGGARKPTRPSSARRSPP